MSKTRYRWWGFVRRMIRDYPGLKLQWTELRTPHTSGNYTAISGAKKDRRITESIALRQMPKEDQKAFDAVTEAVALVSALPGGQEKLKLIKLMYWSDNHLTAKASAVLLYISEITAKRWHGEFVRLVAKCYGFEDDTQEPNKSSIMLL